MFRVALVVSCMFLILYSTRGAAATNVHVVNKTPNTLCIKYWVPNHIGGGCEELKPYEACDVGTTPEWSGATMWAIQGVCAGQACNTGPPSGVSQFEFTIDGFSGFDYYDVSIRAGFNVGISVQPTNPACPSQFCMGPDQCQGMLPNGPDQTRSCASGSTDYVVYYY
ncbi:hypothetical protein KP509_04G094500 [Ceratopteris richardii]|uniref:Thaumatin-like protein n=1 Tax=Ceratopteris richardii TaxID=49495 RepID=A0A8T2V316_CERRI|nr:hypothetical protein KP509_04G094500 [Ceratopteris richardii]